MRLRLAWEHSKRLTALGLLVLFVLAAAVGLELIRQMGAMMQLDPMQRMISMILAFVVGLLNVIPALVALAIIGELAARFVRALYETQDLHEARDICHRNLFGLTGEALRPLLIVKEGHVDVGAGSTHDVVGGPALLVVYNDSAAVLEKGGRLTRIESAYIGPMERFERIWDVVDLRPQRWVMPVHGMTKEGIPVTCEADITFKIDDRYIDAAGKVCVKPPQQKTGLPLTTDSEIASALAGAGIDQPFPYTHEAVFNAAVSTWVRIRQPEHKEQLRRWTGRVMIGEVESILRAILAQYRLDWLLHPTQAKRDHPREEVRRQLEERLQRAFPAGNPVGARILSVELGQINVRDDQIPRQWIEAWRSEWKQRALESLAQEEAKLTNLDAAQIQAQAEMALTLTEAIRPLVTGVEDLPPYLLAMRFVQTLHWMAYDPFKEVFLLPGTLRALEELEKTLAQTYDPGSVPQPAVKEMLARLSRPTTRPKEQ